MKIVYAYLGRLQDALAEFEQTLSLNPNFALGLAYYGQMLSWVRRCEDGIIAARRALRLSPRDPFSAIVAYLAAGAEFLGGHYHEAMRLAREAIRQRPDFVGALPRVDRGSGYGGRDRTRPGLAA
jgi:tetratricopeptide (TPR) repeat protein